MVDARRNPITGERRQSELPHGPPMLHHHFQYRLQQAATVPVDMWKRDRGVKEERKPLLLDCRD